ncbi:Sir2 family NAD+-dependent deacetylase [Halioxenophilus sp. WMMB6]|uniref:Sir2 family NAD+-dependent deacetylase n=1 Tax=Halioxenophilus sp. WMMB6 TaxID=3073815 RepID=UPI00295E3368|nr:Sir2 family NAD+-dependent deacetylase [Halioxenophilus sp. WMMB6]
MKASFPPQSVVVLTGAGISAESGLKTFRDNNGLWEDHRVEEVATPEAFAANPALVQRFYNLRREQLVTGAEPNLAHRKLAEFERDFPGQFTLVTQNVDDLHERAGSHNLLHMHGELLKVHCAVSGQVFERRTPLESDELCPCCAQPGRLRPHIVWFGEIPLYMDEIQAALEHCDLFVSIGTSGNVYPAAGFQQMARQYGAHTVELNLEASVGASHFHEQHYGPATQVVPAYFQNLLMVTHQ